MRARDLRLIRNVHCRERFGVDRGAVVRAAAFVVVIVSILIAQPWMAPTAVREGDGTIVVAGGTLVDGTAREPFPGATIVVRNGRLAEVTAGHVAGLPGTETIDARGKWIVPGLIDMHVHYQPTWMDALFLRHGVTTVRDVGSGLDHILERRKENRSPGTRRPRIFTCGPLIDGPWPRHGSGISVSVQTVGEARAVARRLLERGVDCLKIYEQLTPPLVDAVVREADGTGVPVTAHLRDTTALQALEIGVRGLEHAFGFDACEDSVAADVLRRVVERGAYVVPTLAITEQVSLLGSPEQERMALLGEVPAGRRLYWGRAAAGTPPDRIAGAARRLGCLKSFVARLQRGGGHVVAGSDTSNPYVIPGASLHRELELLADAGLSPRETLATATRNAAAFLGQARTLGTLEVGKTADLVVLGADPLVSVAALRQIELVIRDGRVVWRR